MNETLSLQQLQKEGQAAYQRGDFIAAGRAYEAASLGFVSVHESLSAAEMANNASVAFLRGGDAEAALRNVEGTAATFEAAGDLRRQGMALGNRASALEALGRPSEASKAYQQSAHLLKLAGEDGLRLNVMQSLSTLQLRTGRQLQALATMQAGLEDVKRPTPQQRLLKKLLRVPFRWLDK